MQAFMALIFLCFIPFYANAGVYKWVDASGQTHFGDRPPATAASREITVKAAPDSEDAVARERVFVNEAENARIRADFRQKVKRTCGNE